MKFLKQLTTKSPWVLSIVFLALLALWMISGQFNHGQSGEQSEKASTGLDQSTNKQTAQAGNATKAQGAGLFKVITAPFQPRPFTQSLMFHGITEAKSTVDLRAQTAGRVIKIPVIKGAQVEKKTVVCQIENGGRSATARQAEAILKEAQVDYNAASNLAKRGHGAKLLVFQRKAALEKAKADLEKAQIDLARTTIKAPEDGVIFTLPARIGTFLNVGDLCAKFVQLDPLKIIAHVPEKQIKFLKVNMGGSAVLATGETISGTIDYIAPSADPDTRAFRIELTVDNKDYLLKSGVTATLKLNGPEIKALFIPQSLITLDAGGQMGVYYIKKDKTAHFMPVQILQESKDGLWVTSQFERLELITEGQNFVLKGQKVAPMRKGS